MISCIGKTDTENCIVLKGGTLIDLDNLGISNKDRSDVVIIIKGSKITGLGPGNEIKIPEKSEIIDISGKFIVPGLIDCFSALNNQAYANAHLYMGVTTIVGVQDPRRGALYEAADLSPEIL